MNLDSLSFIRSHISNLIANLSKKNFKQTTAELAHLVSEYGLEADRHLLRCLFSSVDLSSDGGKQSGGSGGSSSSSASNRDSLQTQLLIQEIANLHFKPSLISLICNAFDNPLHSQKTLKPSSSGQLFTALRRVLRLTPVQEAILGLALLHSSQPDLARLAAQFVRTKLPELVAAYIADAASSTRHSAAATEGGLHDTTPEILHLILTSLQTGHFSIADDAREIFTKRLQRDFPREHVPVILAPLIYPHSPDLPMEKPGSADSSPLGASLLDGTLASLLPDVGYSFTSSVEKCKSILVDLAGAEINVQSVAQMMTVMLRSADGKQAGVTFWDPKEGKTTTTEAASWNFEVFVQAVKEVAPNLAWREVFQELDNPEFLIKDRHCFLLLFSGLRLVFDQSSLPVDLFYRRWKNTDGQYSLIMQCLKNPDTFCFAEYPHHSVPTEILKTLPEPDSKEVANWRSLELISTLLYLGECGLYIQVQELFKFPVQNCADVLMLGLLHDPPPLSVIRQELISSLLPTFLGSHPNSAPILQHAWNCPNLYPHTRPVVMGAMADWYLRGEHDQCGRLGRILDVMQDLKALSLILNSQAFPFVIDLACLASRRGYLKLDKWLGDKIHEHGEPFISACVTFLQRRCPQILGKDEPPVSKGQPLIQETITTILGCLQGCACNVSQELQDVIVTMLSNCSLMLNKARQQQQHQQAQQQQMSLAAAVRRHGTPLDPYTAAAVAAGAGGTLEASLAALNLQSSMGLGPLVSTPASPSRVMAAAAQSPFPPPQPSAQGQAPPPLYGMAGLHGVGVASASTLVSMPRHPAQSAVDKTLAAMFGDINNIPKEVEDEANSYFQRIYNHPPHPTLSIEEVLDMLKKFMESPKQREREVYLCMVKNLFEEYRFFPQYPDKELLVTAQLFGGIIERGILPSYTGLGLALRTVLEALRKPTGTKLYYFGIAALDRFKSKLKDYRQYCDHLAGLPHFHDFPQHLIEYVQYGLQNQEPPNHPQGPVLPPQLSSLLHSLPASSITASSFKAVTTTSLSPAAAAVAAATTSSVSGTKTPATFPSRPSIANATNIDTLIVATEKDDVKVITPPEGVQDKIFFIFNNLSQLNLQSKCEELKQCVTEEYYPFMAQYLVMRRITIEHNFHSLYANFLEVLKIPEIHRLVLRETYRNIRILLRSDKGQTNFSDRSLMKNLGHWLGLITLARNKPILHTDLDLKSLIIEAYSKGLQELLFIVPFAAKILDACAKSKIFKPRNPWTMALLGLLAELHSENDVKLTLKFEIEVLVKNVGLELAKIKPSTVLRNIKKSLENIEPQLSQPRPKEPEPTQSHTPTITPTHTPQPMISKSLEEQVSHLAAAGAPGGPMLSLIGQQAAAAAAVAAAAASLPSTASLSVLAQQQPQPQPTPPQPSNDPRFHIMDLNVSTMASMSPFITISPQIALLQAHPQLKGLVRPAVERAVQEWIVPVVERSIKIGASTAEQVVKQDFAADPDEGRMRISAHAIVRVLSGSIAMITCRDHLITTIANNLKVAFTTSLHPGVAASKQQLELIDAAAATIAEDNMELASAFIQKAAIEKAVVEIDNRLKEEYDKRKQARLEGRRYCDPNLLAYQAERAPEAIRRKMASNRFMDIYGDLARNIPGFKPMTERDSRQVHAKAFAESAAVAAAHAQQQQQPQPQAVPTHAATVAAVAAAAQFAAVNQLPFSTDEMSAIYDRVQNDVLLLLQTAVANGILVDPRYAGLPLLREATLHFYRNRDMNTALVLLQRAVEGLLESMRGGHSSDDEFFIRFRDVHLKVLKALQDHRMFGVPWTNKHVTRCLAEARDDIKFNLDALDCLLRSGLVNMSQYDENLHRMLESGNGINYLALVFAIQVVQNYLIEDRLNPIVAEDDLTNTMSILSNIQAMSRENIPPNLQIRLAQMMESLRASHDPTVLTDVPPVGPIGHLHVAISAIMQTRGIEQEENILREKIEVLCSEWLSQFRTQIGTSRDNPKLFMGVVQQMAYQNIQVKSEESIIRFIKMAIAVSMEECIRVMAPSQSIHQRVKTYQTVDALVRLLYLLIKHTCENNHAGRLILINRALGNVTGCLLRDHDTRPNEFQVVPYERFFERFFNELLVMQDPQFEYLSFQILTAYCHVYHNIRPTKAAKFGYAWLELISNRQFLTKLLAQTPQQKGWPMYAQLLTAQFKFLAPYLRNTELGKPIAVMYRGTLKVLLVLLHDFPEFLCENHYGFCDVIPPNCIQMRNLILSAYPRNMRLPDPFIPNLKVDAIPEITVQPHIATNFASVIQPASFKKDLDSYLKLRSPVTFLSELRSHLQQNCDPGMKYNTQLMNALVLYVGTQEIQKQAKQQTANALVGGMNSGSTPLAIAPIASSAHMDIFQNMAVDLDTEGRYLFLNAIANQLRYPNSNTYYFSCLLLSLFAESNTEHIQEQITRILLERLIVNRPHPWGLLITFIELIKNPVYKFWNHDFVHCAPEIEKLFESVARSCMFSKSNSNAMMENDLDHRNNGM